MKIFDLFKKLGKKEESKEITVENLAFSEIENWIKEKTRENQVSEKKVILNVEENIKDFIKELKEKIIILEEFDVSAKKEEDRIKNLVIDNRKKYIEGLEDLIEKLEDLEEPKLEKFTEKINKIFFDFNKSSSKNYETATILIGKEMASIKKSFKVFSKKLLNIFEENKYIINSFKDILIIKEKLKVINLLNKNLEKIYEEKQKLDKRISEKEKQESNLRKNLIEIKNSSSYLENLEKKKKINLLKKELEKSIFNLKQLINFKYLANFFHINPEQMKIVKRYRENFQISFREDNGEALINLLNEAKLNNKTILEKIKQIKVKTEEIKYHKENLKDNELEKVESKINEINIKINNLKIEKIKVEKRQEKLLEDKEELIDLLKQKLKKANVDLVQTKTKYQT